MPARFAGGQARLLLALAGLLALLGPVVVDAEATDATKSESSGNGLQFATAGVLAQFTVTAKDESGVRRTSGGDEWIVELDGTRSITGSVVDNLDGTYQVSYTATKSGSYEAGVKLAKSGGLTGSYFENVWFFYTPVKVTVDPQINMDWGVGRITPTGANYISVRWLVPSLSSFFLVLTRDLPRTCTAVSAPFARRSSVHTVRVLAGTRRGVWVAGSLATHARPPVCWRAPSLKPFQPAIKSAACHGLRETVHHGAPAKNRKFSGADGGRLILHEILVLSQTGKNSEPVLQT
jgi:hypothetical protein